MDFCRQIDKEKNAWRIRISNDIGGLSVTIIGKLAEKDPYVTHHRMYKILMASMIHDDL